MQQFQLVAIHRNLWNEFVETLERFQAELARFNTFYLKLAFEGSSIDMDEGSPYTWECVRQVGVSFSKLLAPRDEAITQLQNSPLEFHSLKLINTVQGESYDAVSNALLHCPDLARACDIVPDSQKTSFLVQLSVQKLGCLLYPPAEFVKRSKDGFLPIPVLYFATVCSLLLRCTLHNDWISDIQKLRYTLPLRIGDVAQAGLRCAMQLLCPSADRIPVPELAAFAEYATFAHGQHDPPLALFLDIGTTTCEFGLFHFDREAAGVRRGVSSSFGSLLHAQALEGFHRLNHPSMVFKSFPKLGLLSELRDVANEVLERRSDILKEIFRLASNRQFEAFSSLCVPGDVIHANERRYTLKHSVYYGNVRWLATTDDDNDNLSDIPSTYEVEIFESRKGSDSADLDTLWALCLDLKASKDSLCKASNAASKILQSYSRCIDCFERLINKIRRWCQLMECSLEWITQGSSVQTGNGDLSLDSLHRGLLEDYASLFASVGEYEVMCRGLLRGTCYPMLCKEWVFVMQSSRTFA
jgi:hypothetical protein